MEVEAPFAGDDGAAAEGYRFDRPLAAAALADEIAGQPWRGLFVAFDYGKTLAELRENTPAGTGRAYHRHRRSDDLLAVAWGSMDRYHLAWLEVGRIAQPLRGREITPDEEAQEIRSVVSAKGAVLRTSLDAVERQGMPFLGETRTRAPEEKSGLPDHLHEAPHGLVGGARALQSAIDAARKEAAEHEEHALNRKSTPQKSDRTDLW